MSILTRKQSTTMREPNLSPDLPQGVLEAARARLDACGHKGVSLSLWARKSYYVRKFWPECVYCGQYDERRKLLKNFRNVIREWLREKGDPPEDQHWIEIAMRDAVLAKPAEHWARIVEKGEAK